MTRAERNRRGGQRWKETHEMYRRTDDRPGGLWDYARARLASQDEERSAALDADPRTWRADPDELPDHPSVPVFARWS